MNLNRRHSASTSASSVYLRGYKEGGEDKEARCHMRARRSSSSEESHHKASIPENRVSTIHKLTESFEKKLHFRTRKTVSLEEDEDPCVICHDGLNAGRVQELHCMHKFHKECIEKWLRKKQTCPTCRVQVVIPEPFSWSLARMKFP